MQIKNTITVTVQAGIEKKSFEIPVSEYYTLMRKLEMMNKEIKTTPNLIRKPFK